MQEALTAVADAQAMPAGGEQQQNAANASETPEVELENDNEVVDGEEGEGEGDEQPELELADVEYEGKAYKLPPELKDALLRTADYTRKTQEVAEQRKTVEAKMAEAQAAYQTSQEVIEARAVAHHIDSQLKQYENVNWQALENEDPMAAMSHWRQFQQLQQQRGQVAQYLDKTQADLSEKAKQATADRLRETRAFAEKELKGWSPDLDNKITEFATKDLGFSVDSLREQYTPQVYRTLYLAHIGHLALQKQTAAPRAAAPAAQPLNKVTARANPPPTGLDDRLPQDEWLKRRQAQLAKRG
jgi:chaperonin cofactor prefoldin